MAQLLSETQPVPVKCAHSTKLATSSIRTALLIHLPTGAHYTPTQMKAVVSSKKQYERRLVDVVLSYHVNCRVE